MAFVDPTAAEVKARFAEFASVADATIDALIAESALYVDETWLESDFTLAKMFWIAHAMAIEGMGTSAASQVAALGDFSRIKSGDLEVARNSGSGGAQASGPSGEAPFQRTRYGERFLELRARSHPGVCIA